jgi:hypothetical protein
LGAIAEHYVRTVEQNAREPVFLIVSVSNFRRATLPKDVEMQKKRMQGCGIKARSSIRAIQYWSAPMAASSIDINSRFCGGTRAGVSIVLPGHASIGLFRNTAGT